MAIEERTVKPDLASGTRDLLPAEALAYRNMVETIIAVYESFGFVPLETPCMEKFGVLTGNDPFFNKSIFRASVVRGQEDRDTKESDLLSQDTALRFDLTVPLARVVASYPRLPRPFKRYQIGRVFRGEQAQAGRFREFTQLDFDIIGSSSIYSDIEVLQVMYSVMIELGIKDFIIRFNTRKVLNGLSESIEVTGSRAKELFRIIDKLEKTGIDAMYQELRRSPDPNWLDDPALELSEESAQRVVSFVSITGKDSNERILKLSSLLGEKSKTAVSGIEELMSIVNALHNLGISERNWCVDFSIARGLDYYTGPVFEVYLSSFPELGSVFSGGRFDGLTNRFIIGSNVPGVGASVGIDRMIIGMKKLGLLSETAGVASLLVTVFSDDIKLTNRSMLFAQSARKRGIKTEFYLGEDRTIRAQFSYAAKQGIPYVVVIGPDEFDKGVVQIKDMKQRRQEVLTDEDVFAMLASV